MNFAFKKPFSFHLANQQAKTNITEGRITTPISPDSPISEIQDPNSRREHMMRKAELSRK